MRNKKPRWMNDPDAWAAGMIAATRVMIEMAPKGFKKEIFIANLILQILPQQLPMSLESETEKEKTGAAKG